MLAGLLRTAVLVAAALLVIALVGLAVHLQSLGPPPPMARDGDLIDVGVPSPEWSARLRQEFPVGTPEHSLVQRLKSQSFAVDITSRTASYEWRDIVCAYTVTVEWSLDRNRNVTDVRGGYTSACL
jgi:hypothetical protein